MQLIGERVLQGHVPLDKVCGDEMFFAIETLTFYVFHSATKKKKPSRGLNLYVTDPVTSWKCLRKRLESGQIVYKG